MNLLMALHTAKASLARGLSFCLRERWLAIRGDGKAGAKPAGGRVAQWRPTEQE
jgi:hypothetical protein